MAEDADQLQEQQEAYYDDYRTVDGPGRAAIVVSPHSGGWAAVFTDDKRAGGVATAEGQDDVWAAMLAEYWLEAAQDGYTPEDAFDNLAYEYADGVAKLGNLARDLALFTGLYTAEELDDRDE